MAVTTLIDYYQLPSDAPGTSNMPAGPARAKVAHLEKRIDESMSDSRMRSYLALHEFESLLYADPGECGRYLEKPELTAAMSEAVASCGAPELVNDDPATAPSKRIHAACASFRKTLDGPTLVQRIGLATVRDACPHFNQWLSWLESLGNS